MDRLHTTNKYINTFIDSERENYKTNWENNAFRHEIVLKDNRGITSWGLAPQNNIPRLVVKYNAFGDLDEIFYRRSYSLGVIVLLQNDMWSDIALNQLPRHIQNAVHRVRQHWALEH
ncbi:hypothetical protein WDV76_09110 [Xenorhabdus griffiniae]|uniref:hypothetical protein n=1 Tax=Xenorhabdus griffiniae TaxID=351672 RepID=UPI00235A43AF|nr:hypothetical protein [Xenorhabdus griffiniae]MDC9607360.1 hypothetical protein [Xenorhabdus griffiniae]